MKITTVLGDMLRSLFQRPVTRPYPQVRQPPPQRLRGQVRWNPQQCTGCCLCAKDCPANAIEIITVDKAQKRFVMRYHLDRCAFCAQCVQNCRGKCLEMSNADWELAALSKEPFTVYYGDENDIRAILDKFAGAENAPAPEA
jgi:formate hydrogenlyase subunit 6/NADH:ubiquinone oxidoreductase subunit I